MSSCLYITHLQPPNQILRSRLETKGFFCHHTPLIKERPRKILEPPYRDFAILTSFTAIKHMEPWLNYFSEIYCIGEQTALYAASFIEDRQKIHWGNMQDPSLSALVKQKHHRFQDRQGVWYGSSAGLYKHQKLFQDYPQIFPEITHWNWPDYIAANTLSKKINVGYLICSSISATIAIGANFWADDVKFILSSARLQKYLPQDWSGKIQISSNWPIDFARKIL